MRTMISIVSVSLFFVFIGLKCSQPMQQSDGGGTETVIGVIKNSDGSYASGTEVKLIPENYNPVADDEIPDSMITTTDTNGEFIFSPVLPGTYNIQAINPVNKLRLFRPGVTVTTDDTTYLSTNILKEAGAIKVIMPDTVDTVNGYVYIRGTTIHSKLAEGNSIEGSLYSLVVDSIPAATFERLQYTVEYNPGDPVELKDVFTVSSKDTVLIEAFDYLVVIGSVVYENGVYASGVKVQIIPKDYIPLKDSELPAQMTDTTDINGVFIVKVTEKGIYNIQAVHPGLDLHLFQPLVTVDRDTVNLSAIELKEQGIIKLIMPDTMDTVDGYVYIEGTKIYKKLSGGNWLDTGFYILYLDSTPAASYPALYYAVQNSSIAPVQLTDSFTVSSEDTILLEAFVSWKHYTTGNSGLPSNTVLDMAIDSSGLKWFGTDRGAVAYGGRNWIVYDKNNSGLLSDTVMSITVNSDGAIWCGTTNGIAKYDGIEWVTFTTGNSQLPNDSVFEIVANGNGDVWVGTDSGVAKYDDAATWEVYTPDNSPLPHPEAYCIAIDHDGTKWFGTDGGGVARFDGNNWTIYDEHNSSLLTGAIFSIAIDDAGNKWIGGSGGVALYDGTSWSFFNTGNYMNYAYTVSAIGIDKDNIKWLGTYEGGRIFGLSGTKMKCYNSETSIISPNAYEMYAIVVDEENNKWVTTSRGGIYVFGPIH